MSRSANQSRWFSSLETPDRQSAEALRGAGYATGLFGKWHLGYAPEHNPTRHGFDEFRGFVSGNIDYHSHLDRMGTADWYHGEELVEREGYLTELVTEDAVDIVPVTLGEVRVTIDIASVVAFSKSQRVRPCRAEPGPQVREWRLTRSSR